MNPLANLLDWDTVEKSLIEALNSHSLIHRLQTLVAGESIVLVRNWYGHLMLLLPCVRSELERSECMPLVEDLRLRVGSLALPTWVICRDELFDANSYWSDPDLLSLLNEPVQFMILERQKREEECLLAAYKVS